MSTEKVVEMIPYLVGYYKPTYEFTRIPEFMAIFDRQGTLVGLTGPATSRQAAWDARLFALSPKMFMALQDLCKALDDPYVLEQQSENSLENSKLHAALKQAQTLLQQMESGMPIRG